MEEIQRATIIEAEAISFVFKLAFGILSGIVGVVYLIIWNLYSKIAENKERFNATIEKQADKIALLEKDLAVNSERDTHIDKELSDIKNWTENWKT